MNSKKMKKIMLIFGTRPEAIKMAPVIKALEQHSELQPVVCITAQHRQMLDQVMKLFEIEAEIDLDLMQPNQNLANLSARIMQQITPHLERISPAAVLVQGDTTSTLFGAIASFYQGIPIGHIEAGLRTGDMHSPFPEEMNRVLTTRLTRWHFAPTQHNRNTLLDEHVNESQIYVTGNTIIDALLLIRDRLEKGTCSTETSVFMNQFKRPYILVTGHRRESFGPGFESICHALASLAYNHPDIDIIYPVHLNPNVQNPVNRILKKNHNIKLIPPQGYENFVALMNSSLFILTDSGGVQEEAPSLGKPVLVMRQKTERIEGLSGGVKLVGTDHEIILNECERLLCEDGHYNLMSEATNPYGDGHAAARITDILHRSLNLSSH
ncbi:MAG: UDP-N-acetylglucosamine 2-epimerase (non-hydrolyzing) [Candidatus Sedimenticola endophacoides]